VSRRTRCGEVRFGSLTMEWSSVNSSSAFMRADGATAQRVVIDMTALSHLISVHMPAGYISSFIVSSIPVFY
jgi:hypothetical protein